MHFDFRKAVGITMLPLLAGALAVGVAASPASAQTWQDDRYRRVQPHSADRRDRGRGRGQGGSERKWQPADLYRAGGSAIHRGDAHRPDGTIWHAIMTSTASQVVLGTRGSGTGTATLSFTIQSTSNVITCTARQTVNVIETGGVLSLGTVSSLPSEAPVTISVYNNSTIRAVEFSGAVTEAGSLQRDVFAVDNLPPDDVRQPGAGHVGGTAAPGTYGGVPHGDCDRLGTTFTGGHV